MNKIKPSLTVAIPAHNEENNIENLIKNILRQKQKYITLKDIKIYTDACTDQTIPIIKRLQKNYPQIKLIEGKTRHGKMYRQNQIFADCKSDILILFDADVYPISQNFIDNLSKELIDDPKANLVVAHQIPLQPKSFIGKILTATFIMWDYVRLSVPNQDHLQNFYPSACAYRGTFARILKFPKAATEDRIYIYLMAKKTNSFRYTFKAKANYWTVSTMRDYINLSHRSFGSKQPGLEKLFGKQVNTLHIIPIKYKIIGILKSFYYQPFYTPLAILLGFLLGKMTTRKATANTGLWEISTSTKKSFK